MKVLITGGAGFIGSHITRKFIELGHDVSILDNFSTGKRENILGIESDVAVFEGDIRDFDLVSGAMRGVDLVLHEAALPSVPRSIQDPITSLSVNVLGTTTVLKAAVDAGVRRVVYAASSSAYGNSVQPYKSERLPNLPRSPYAVSKLAGEYLLQAFSTCYGIETVGLRYFNVFGERQDPNSQYSGVIAKFCRLMLAGEAPTVYGDGETARDFTYVANVVEANVLAATAPLPGVGPVLNIACGGSITLNELVRVLNEIIGTHLAPTYAPERTGDVKYSCADIGLAGQVLGYSPRVDFVAGLRATVNWYRSKLADGVN